jgi:oleate hydratase
LDITGYYQFEYLFMPIYLHLLELGVDYQFNVQIRAIGLSQVNKQQRMVTRLDFAHNGFEVSRTLQWSDIVIATVGSTISGCFVGADDRAPGLPELDVTEGLDENWSVWLELANKVAQFGNPYNFCTRSGESMLESFTITTEDLELYDKLNLLSLKKSAVGTVIALFDSHWKLNVCVPLQPVFSNQPTNQRVLWGYAGSPRSEGNYVRKAMVDCSGSEILSELLAHLNIRSQPSMRRTITIPRVLPRMTAHLLPRSPTDRLDIIPKTAVNIGLVGPFVNIPYYTAADISYGVRSARVAVSRLMGLGDYDDEDAKNKYLGTVLLNTLKVIF